jgi:hypothetical protein
MWEHGQKIDRHEVEPWIAEAFPYPYFLASVTEKEEPQHNRIRIITTVTGPNGEDIVNLALNRKASYYSLRASAQFPQFAEDWTT